MKLLDVFGHDAGLHRLLDQTPPHLVFPGPEGGENRLRVQPGSVFDTLHRYAEGLAGLMGWPESGAVWFVLTGQAPMIEPVTAGVTRFATGLERVVITASLFASRATVWKAYSRAVRRRGRTGTAEATTAALVDFADRATAENGGTRPTWDALWKRWQRERPTWCLPYQDFRDFRQTYVRGKRKLTGTGRPTPKQTPPRPRPSRVAKPRGQR